MQISLVAPISEFRRNKEMYASEKLDEIIIRNRNQETWLDGKIL